MERSLDPREAFFDQLSDSWDSLGGCLDAELVMRLITCLEVGPGDTVLDVGSGTGVLIPALAQHQPDRIIACDISAGMLGKLAAKYPGLECLSCLKAAADDLPLPDGSISVILCNGVYPHFEDKAATLAELFRVLAPGGRIAVSHFGGREFVNRIHANSASPVIREDLLPSGEEIARTLELAGFRIDDVVDDDRFLLVAGGKG